jgi:glycosyltransferase involved in cell wall biosynthesis
MKILYVTTGLETGGAEIMLYQLLSRINREQFNPTVISLMDRGTVGDRIESLGIPVYTIGMELGTPTLNAIWKLIQKVREIQPDLIQGWMYHGNIAAKFASIFYFRQIPILWSIHHSISSLKSEKKLTIALIKLGASITKSIQQVIFVSQNSKNQHETLGYKSDNSCIIANGFDVSLFKPSLTARLDFRAEFNLPEESFLIGLICRFHPMKDHVNFLNAAALLTKQFPNVHFILAGREVDSKNDILLQLIKKLNLDKQVHLLGERRDTHHLAAALDIVSLASAYGEAFPLVVGEAMSCGVPCVVTDVGDSGWIVGNTGRIIPPRNPEALANAWQELIVMGPVLREDLGKAARARIIECFSLDSVVAKYEKLYNGMLATRLKSQSLERLQKLQNIKNYD